jgi:hypothetical protein
MPPRSKDPATIAMSTIRMARAQDASAFERITKDILNAQNDTSPIFLALRRADISSLVNLLDLLEYVPATQENTAASNRAQRLSIGHRNMIKWLLKWLHQLWLDNGKVPLDANQWNLVSLPVDRFNDIRIRGGLCLNTSPDYTQAANKKTDSVVVSRKGSNETVLCTLFSRTRSIGIVGIGLSLLKPVVAI